MGEVIPFDNPLSRLRRELEEKEKELQSVKQQLHDTRQSISAITSVNELLKLQLHDLMTNIRKLQESLNIVTGNVQNLQSRLPTIEFKES